MSIQPCLFGSFRKIASSDTLYSFIITNVTVDIGANHIFKVEIKKICFFDGISAISWKLSIWMKKISIIGFERALRKYIYLVGANKGNVNSIQSNCYHSSCLFPFAFPCFPSYSPFPFHICRRFIFLTLCLKTFFF